MKRYIKERSLDYFSEDIAIKNLVMKEIVPPVEKRSNKRNSDTKLTYKEEFAYLKEYDKLDSVLVGEGKYPLSSPQKLLDNVGLFNRRKRNLYILENSGYKDEVETMRIVASKYLDLSKKAIPETIEKESMFVPVWIHDIYFKFPRLQLYYTMEFNFKVYVAQYAIPLGQWFAEFGFSRDFFPVILSLPRRISSWYGDFKVFIKSKENMFNEIGIYIYEAGYSIYLYIRSSLKYIEYWYYINWKTLSFQLFVDIFYYWYYDVPEAYQRDFYRGI